METMVSRSQDIIAQENANMSEEPRMSDEKQTFSSELEIPKGIHIVKPKV